MKNSWWLSVRETIFDRAINHSFSKHSVAVKASKFLVLLMLLTSVTNVGYAYDQRNIKPWDGLYGVTAAWEWRGELSVVSQDKIWKRRPDGTWYLKGFLGQYWQNAPIIDINDPNNITGERDSTRLKKRPYEYPGVTAAFMNGPDDRYVISHDRYWRYNYATWSWTEAGFLRDAFPNAPSLYDGEEERTPYDGVTGAYLVGNKLRLISKDAIWVWDYNTSSWSAHFLRDVWSHAPLVNGVRMYDGVGVTGAYNSGNLVTVISVDKYWTFEYSPNLYPIWKSSGLIKDLWSNVPGIDAGWSHPIGGDSNSDWAISQRQGTCVSGIGCGHLGHDIARKEGHFLSVGQQISAAAQGKVVAIRRPLCGDYYNPVVIEHIVPDINNEHAPIYTFYGHITVDPNLREGQWVQKGQVIGTLPDPIADGHGFGAHLHFEVQNSLGLLYGSHSNCTQRQRGWFISAGYSGSWFPDPIEYHEDNLRRYYSPSEFVRRRGGGSLLNQ